MSCKVSEFDGFYGLRLARIVYVAPMVEVRSVNWNITYGITRGVRGVLPRGSGRYHRHANTRINSGVMEKWRARWSGISGISCEFSHVTNKRTITN